MFEYDKIETPQNVELTRPLAGIGSRMMAGFADNIIIFLIYLLLFLFVMLYYSFEINEPLQLLRNGDTLVFTLIIIAGFVLYWGYFALSEYYMNGQTIGKRNLKIRVVKLEGGPLSFTDLAIRNLLRAADFLFLYLVAGVVMFFTKRVQRLGDLAAGTVVISEDVVNYASANDYKNTLSVDSNLEAGILRVHGISAETYRALNSYLKRRHEFSMEVRLKIFGKLLNTLNHEAGEQLDERLKQPVSATTITNQEILVEQFFNELENPGTDERPVA